MSFARAVFLVFCSVTTVLCLPRARSKTQQVGIFNILKWKTPLFLVSSLRRRRRRRRRPLASRAARCTARARVAEPNHHRVSALPVMSPSLSCFVYLGTHRSILISVVVFGHSVVWWQWVGVLCVFGGLSLSVRAKYAAKKGGVKFAAGDGHKKEL